MPLMMIQSFDEFVEEHGGSTSLLAGRCCSPMVGHATSRSRSAVPLQGTSMTASTFKGSLSKSNFARP